MLRAVVVMVLVACGDNKLPITLEQYPEAWRDALCEWYVRCGYLPNIETCVGLFPPVNLNPDLVAAVDAKLTVFHPDAAYRCVTWLEFLGCDPTTAEYREPACFGIFTGTLPDGELCAFGAECISRECFWATDSQCEQACCRGVCTGNTPPTLGRIGDRCRYSDCLEGYCDGNLCLEYKPEGATCEFDGECDVGLSCLIDTCERWPCTGTCTRLPGAGEPCTDECREHGQTCSSDTGRCERWRFGGERCLVPGDCSPFFDCSADRTASYSCRARGGGLGASCAGPFAPCTPPYVCESLTYKCVEPRADGERCRSGGECASLRCDQSNPDFTKWTCVPYETCI